MNEDLTFKKHCELVHFQSSARSAKKSNDFFGLKSITQSEPISKIDFEEIFKYLAIMQDGFCRQCQREFGQKSQRGRMDKGTEKFQKVF